MPRPLPHAETVPAGAPPATTLFREVAAAGRQALARRWLLLRRYGRYYWLTLKDSLFAPRAPRAAAAGGART